MHSDIEFLENIQKGAAELSKLPSIRYQYNDRELVYQYQEVKLYHYKNKIKAPHKRPLLIVFATVNKSEILDLLPHHSFIHHLLEQGENIYLLDWGVPSDTNQSIQFETYVTEYLHRCVSFIRQHAHQTKINLLGICQGGVLSICYASLYRVIQNLILISTPIDFHTKKNQITKLIKTFDLNMIDKYPKVPGEWLTQFFISLRPFDLIGKKYLRFVNQIDDEIATDKFLRVEKWLHDAPDQPSVAFKEFLQHFYRDNKLIEGKIKMGKKRVSIQNLTIPVLNITARKDEIVPPCASKALKRYIHSSYTQRSFPSGHIGIYINEHVSQKMAKSIANWLKKQV